MSKSNITEDVANIIVSWFNPGDTFLTTDIVKLIPWAGNGGLSNSVSRVSASLCYLRSVGFLGNVCRRQSGNVWVLNDMPITALVFHAAKEGFHRNRKRKSIPRSEPEHGLRFFILEDTDPAVLRSRAEDHLSEAVRLEAVASSVQLFSRST